jgi:hypothetical protein
MRKLFFYTTKKSSETHYYLGKGNNSFSEEQIKGMMRKNKILMLPNKIELKDKKGLWLNSKGQVFYADLKAPHNDPEKCDLNFAPKELRRLNAVYNSLKATRGIPKVSFGQKLPS